MVNRWLLYPHPLLFRLMFVVIFVFGIVFKFGIHDIYNFAVIDLGDLDYVLLFTLRQ